MNTRNPISLTTDPNALPPSDGIFGSNKTHPLWGKGIILKVWGETWDVSLMDDYRHGWSIMGLVWNAAKGKPEVTTIQSREGAYGIREIVTPWSADATPEIQAAYAKWVMKEFVPLYALRKGTDAASAVIKDAYTAWKDYADTVSRVGRNDIVMVVKGRKFAHGLTGKAFWRGESNYGGFKLGVALTDRKDAKGRNTDVMWISESNVERVLSAEEKTQLKSLEEAHATASSATTLDSRIREAESEVSRMSMDAVITMSQQYAMNPNSIFSWVQYNEKATSYGGDWY